MDLILLSILDNRLSELSRGIVPSQEQTESFILYWELIPANYRAALRARYTLALHSQYYNLGSNGQTIARCIL